MAVDRVTGGANEGFFFQNTVLAPARRAVFRVKLRVERPSADEARWLASAVRAIDRGLMRVGSSKAGGRLALAAPPQAQGPEAEAFTALAPSEVE